LKIIYYNGKSVLFHEDEFSVLFAENFNTFKNKLLIYKIYITSALLTAGKHLHISGFPSSRTVLKKMLKKLGKNVVIFCSLKFNSVIAKRQSERTWVNPTPYTAAEA
jgi:hypothetical protein